MFHVERPSPAACGPLRAVRWAATSVFYRNDAATKPIVLNIGGARSSKSYSVLQLFIARFFGMRNKTFLTTRKTFPALRITAYKQVVDMLKQYDLYDRVEHNKSDKTFRLPWAGNYWLFSSIDDPEKIKSTEFNAIHMEEGNEFTYDDYRILKLRLSAPCGPGERNQIFITLNPSDDQGWIRQELMQKEPHDLIHSTYRDNPFLSAEYIRELESLKDQDETYWLIYGEGQFAAVKEMVFGPMTITDTPLSGADTIYGLDFGYNNPTTLVECNVKEWTVLCRELLYERMLTNADLIARLEALIPPAERKRPIYCDSAEPARIEEIGRAGFNTHPSDKDVLAGILFVKRFKRFSTVDSVNLNREFRSYKWRQDRNGKVLDEPVRFEDHTPGAVRYALYTHLGKPGKGYYFGFTKTDVW